jgi:hypothetical protein
MTQTTETGATGRKYDPWVEANVAYFRSCAESGHFYQQPANYSGLENFDGRDYVVLQNVNGPLAVFDVNDDGSVTAIEDYTQWPGGLGDFAES